MSDIQKQMIELSAMDLVSSVAASRKISPSKAMAVVYKSPFFLKLQDPETGLYRESKDYLLALFNRETIVSALRKKKFVKSGNRAACQPVVERLLSKTSKR